ncbi:MAG: hypothetical protein LIO87_00300 [Eubacterium sp.]|nr:hypothetical protein [Eubacterium sp.]
MNTIDMIVSMTQEMTEAGKNKVLDYVKLIYSADVTPSPFSPLSSDEILGKLELGRKQNNNSEGISFDKAIKHIGIENGFI